MQLSAGALLPWQKASCSSAIFSPKPTSIPLRYLVSPNPSLLPPYLLSLSKIRTHGEHNRSCISMSASSSNHNNSGADLQLFRRIRTSAGALILSLAAALAALHTAKLGAAPARAEAFPVAPIAEEEDKSALSQFLESNAEATEALRTLLYEKLDNGEFVESLSILDKLISAQPLETEWRFLSARVRDEMGDFAGARLRLEEILAADPLSYEALLQMVVLMDRYGEGEAAMALLEDALQLAREEEKEKEARDVRLIMAQLQFLQKNVDDAISSYEELAREDPRDYRPFFCQGVIYSLMDRNEEAREKFAKYKRLSPRKFDVDGFLQTSLSRVKLF